MIWNFDAEGCGREFEEGIWKCSECDYDVCLRCFNEEVSGARFERFMERLLRMVNAGDAAAQNELAMFSGSGTRKDEREAARLYKLAAVQGHASAQVNLAVSYKDGTGVTTNSFARYIRFARDILGSPSPCCGSAAAARASMKSKWYSAVVSNRPALRVTVSI
jgi:TPR repeat protein